MGLGFSFEALSVMLRVVDGRFRDDQGRKMSLVLLLVVVVPRLLQKPLDLFMVDTGWVDPMVQPLSGS